MWKRCRPFPRARSFVLFAGCESFALPCFLLLGDRPAAAGNCAARAPLGARVGSRALAVGGQAAPVPDAAIAVDLDQALDVLAHLLSQLAFHGVVLVDVLKYARYLVVGHVKQ